MKRQMEVAKRSSLEIPMAPGNSWLRDLYMSFSFKKILFAIPVLLAFFAMLLHGQQSGGSSDEFNLTMVGDSEILTPAVVHQNNPRFMAIANAVRQGDAAFTNVEEPYPLSKKAYPAGQPRNQWHTTSPAMLKQLQWIGFNLFGAANNHSMDFGIQGLL